MRSVHRASLGKLRPAAAFALQRRVPGVQTGLAASPRVAAERVRLQAAFGDAIHPERPFVRALGDVTTNGAPVQRQDPEGKAVVDELTNPEWVPAGARVEGPVSRPITGAELHVLLRGAAVAAWNTYSYHATKAANVESIKTHGLDPHYGGTGAAAGSGTFAAHSRGHVHYTRNLGLAGDYKRHFEGQTPFGRRDPAPAPAEILQVAIPREIVDREEVDPDSKIYDRAFRTRAAVPGRFIRSTEPVPLPPERPARGKGKKRRPEPLEPGANARPWRDHVDRVFAETSALLSNMPTSATNVLYDIMKRGLDVNVVMHTLSQALRSMAIDSILEFTKEDRAANPRMNQGQMDATGAFLPLKPLRRGQ